MDIGDKVLLRDGRHGVIINKEVPSCKCKGQGNWVIRIENSINTDDTIKLPIGVNLTVVN